MPYRQAKWDEPLIFDISKPGKRGHMVPAPEPKVSQALPSPLDLIPERLRRRAPPALPEVSEPEVVRHFFRLSQQNFSVDLGTYPLGSCTMKYNPKVCEAIANLPKITQMHPYQDETLAQGCLEVMYRLAEYLAEITGMSKVSLQPAAGAQAELAGALIIRAYHRDNGSLEERNEMVVPDSAHGTNPASATMAGFKVVVVPSDEEGLVDLEALKGVVGRRTAGLMITNPNTLGLFERNIVEIASTVHEAGGLLYYDGANLNAILGKSRPGDMGLDLVHMNLHKTFAVPHGGGGPGAGPLGATKELEKYLPVPMVEYDGQRYYLDYNRPHSIGRVRSFYGNFGHLVRAYVYILSLGGEGLERATEIAVLNANYVMRRLLGKRGYSLPRSQGSPRMHEFVLSAEPLMKETGVRAIDVCKGLLDYGIHAPSMYFPLIVEEALMIEPTETESLEELDRFVDVMHRLHDEAYEDPGRLLKAPQNTSVGRLDEVKASHPRTMRLTWRPPKREGAVASERG